MAKNVEIFAFNNAIGLWTVGNGKVGRNVEEMAEGCHDVTREVGGVIATQVEGSAITSKDRKKRLCCRLGCVVERRYEFHIRSKTADDDEDIKVSAARGRKRTESVDGNCDERFVGLGGSEFWDGDCRPRLVLLTVPAGLNEIHNMRFNAVPGVAIQPKKLESNVDAMVAHEMIVVIAENYQLVRRDWEGQRGRCRCSRADGALGDEVIDVPLRVRPVKVVGVKHASDD